MPSYIFMEINFLKIASATLLVFLSGLLRESDCLAQTIRSSTQRELKIVDPTSITGQGIGIRAAAGTSSYTLTLPATAPTLNQNLSASAINGGNITLTWNTPLTATAGTTNYIPKFTSSNTIGNSQLFDNGTIAFLGNGDVNTAPSTAILSSTGGSGTNIAGAEFRLRGGASTGSAAGGPITFYTSAAGTAGTTANTATERARITSAGRLLLGTSTESTFLLDVNGTARFFNNLTSTSNFSISGIAADGRMALYSTNSSGTIQLLAGWGGLSGGSAVLFPGNVNSLGLLGAVGYFNGQLALQSHVVGTGFVNNGTHKSLAIVTPQSPITTGGWSPSADFNDILTFSCAANTFSGTRPNLRYTALSHVFRVNNGTGQNNPGTIALYIDSTSTIFMGNGETNSPPLTGIVSATGGTGTNIAGAEFRIRGGASTGSAAGGPITFYTSAAGSSGTGVNAATERMRLDANGNLGLGVTPSAWNLSGGVLEIKGNAYIASTTSTLSLVTNAFFNGSSWIYKSTGTANRYETISGQHRWYAAPSGTAGNSASFTQHMTLDALGNLGIGLTTGGSFGSRLQVNGGAAIGYSASTAAPTNGLVVAGDVGIGILNPTRPLHLDRGDATASYLQYTAGSTTGQTVNDGFHVGIDNTGLAILNQQENLGLQVMTNNTTRLTIAAGGDATFTGSVTGTSFFESSDSRLKDLIKRDGDVAYFTWKDKRDTKTHIGYLAQEIQQHMPDQVKADENGFLSVNYIEVLVAKIRLLEKKIEELEKKNKRHEKK